MLPGIRNSYHNKESVMLCVLQCWSTRIGRTELVCLVTYSNKAFRDHSCDCHLRNHGTRAAAT